MRILGFLNSLTLGGTEKAACRWGRGLKELGHEVIFLSLNDGPRRSDLERFGVPLRIVAPAPEAIAAALKETGPDLIHTHAPGQPHQGDVLGGALALLRKKIPVVQTNIFGLFQNPAEDRWTDFRLFISWTSCVQAARRAFRRLDEAFFRRNSVAVYPLDPVELPPAAETREFRRQLRVAEDDVLFGRLSRPEPNKWTPLVLEAFRAASRRDPKLRLLLREPPPAVSQHLRSSTDAGRFVILQATADPDELRRTMSALDGVIHTSSIGESFGYGIAEPMNLGKPVITHSVPWSDQAQIELVRPGECGFVASTTRSMAEAIATVANDPALRARMGSAGRKHIAALADPKTSINRMEQIFLAVAANRDNPFAAEDLRRAKKTAAYLDAHQFGGSIEEQLALRPRYYRTRFYEFRRALLRRRVA